MARRDAVHAAALAAVRAAFGAILFGLVGGVGLATAVLSSAGDRPTTVEAALGIHDDPTLDRRRADAVAVLTADCMQERGLPWLAVPEPAPQLPDPDLEPVEWARRWGFGLSTMVGAPPRHRRPRTRTWQRPTGPIHRREPRTGGRSMDRMGRAAVMTSPPMRSSVCETGSWRPCGMPSTSSMRGSRLTRPRGEPSLPGAGVSGRSRQGSPPIVDRWQALCWDDTTPASGTWPVCARSRDSLPLQADERRVATVVAECELAYAAARAAAAAPHEATFVAEHHGALTTIGAAIRAAEAALPTLPPAAP